MPVTPFPRRLRAEVAMPTAYSLPEQSWTSTAVPLGETIRALALSIMGSSEQAPDHPWRDHLRSLLAPLREAFAEHRAVTEGDRGLYADVVHDAPRLARAVSGLVAEHHTLDTAMARLASIADEVSADAEALRLGAMEVLDDLARHRQNDADLVYEAYATDIGGE